MKIVISVFFIEINHLPCLSWISVLQNANISFGLCIDRWHMWGIRFCFSHEAMSCFVLFFYILSSKFLPNFFSALSTNHIPVSFPSVMFREMVRIWKVTPEFQAKFAQSKTPYLIRFRIFFFFFFFIGAVVANVWQPVSMATSTRQLQ